MQAGFHKEKITPNFSVKMAGYAGRTEGSKGTHDELYAHTAVLEEKGRKLVLLSLDLLEVTQELSGDLKKEITKNLGLKTEQILISATHTHSGPLVSTWFGEEANQKTIDKILIASIKAVELANAKLSKVSLKSVETKVQGVGKNRRTLEESLDQNLIALGFYQKNELQGVIANFPLHPTVLGSDNLLFSADYIAYLRGEIKEKYPGAETIFLNGAAGDLNIGYFADSSALGEIIDFRTFQKAEEVGRKLGQAILIGLEKSPFDLETKMRFKEVKLNLPLKELPTIISLEEQIKQLKRLPDKELNTIYLKCLKDAIEKYKGEAKKELTIPIQALIIGTNLIITIPGEPFVEIGLAIKEVYPKNKVIIAGYSNGYFGYFPTLKAYQEGGYEAETSIFAKTSGALLVRGSIDLLRNLLKEGD